VAVQDAPVQVDTVLAGTAGLTGAVTQAGSGTPVIGATATLTDSRGEVVGTQVTDDQGGYGFPELVAGSYTLVISAQDCRPTARTVTVTGTGDTHQDVELLGGTRLHGVARSGACDRPVADARITVLDAAGNIVGVTDTDEGGQYSFSDMVSGEYTVIASGYPPAAGVVHLDGTGNGRYDPELGHGRD
jgi:uncharacterized protein YfaS (alpha-2-macroglobulin family)